MGRRRAIVACFVVAMVALVAIVWLGRDDGRSRRPGDATGGAGAASERPGASRSSVPVEYDGRAPATIVDRARRDELRRKIIEAWANGGGNEPHATAPRPPDQIPPMPRGADGKVDPQYIKDVVKADLMPLVKKCYEELETRKPDLRGRISLRFKIVGDDTLGGIVDETTLPEDAGILSTDERFTTCVRESTMTLSFRPPTEKMSVVVPMSIVLGDRDE